MSYVKVSDNGDFILTTDNVLLVFGNRISVNPMQYRITISNSVFLYPCYSNIVKDFFIEYFTENALFEFTRCIRKHKRYDYYDFNDCDFTAVLVNPFWNRMETYSVDETLKIIDDALCHGFEFKVENGNVYFREIMNKIWTKSSQIVNILYIF